MFLLHSQIDFKIKREIFIFRVSHRNRNTALQNVTQLALTAMSNRTLHRPTYTSLDCHVVTDTDTAEHAPTATPQRNVTHTNLPRLPVHVQTFHPLRENLQRLLAFRHQENHSYHQ